MAGFAIFPDPYYWPMAADNPLCYTFLIKDPFAEVFNYHRHQHHDTMIVYRPLLSLCAILLYFICLFDLFIYLLF